MKTFEVPETQNNTIPGPWIQLFGNPLNPRAEKTFKKPLKNFNPWILEIQIKTFKKFSILALEGKSGIREGLTLEGNSEIRDQNA